MRTGAEFIPPWVDREELEQAAALARLEAEATGFDPDIAERRERAGFVRRARQERARERPAGGLAWLPEARKVRALSPPICQTMGQRRKFLRNQAILLSNLAGFSHRQLAFVFGLPHSRISAVVAEMRARAGLVSDPPTPGP